MVKVFVIGGDLIALLVVTYLVGWIIESIVTGGLFQPSNRLAAQRRQVAYDRKQARVISDGIHVKRMLDAEAFAVHQEMLRVAREHVTRR